MNEILLYTSIGSYVITIGAIGYAYYVEKKYKKKESYAIFIDEKTDSVINSKNVSKYKNSFTYKKESYNLIGSKYTIGNKTYYMYVKGRSDPVCIINNENSRLSADVYEAILNETFTKKLNDYATGLLTNLSPKQIIIGLAVLGFAYYMLMGQ